MVRSLWRIAIRDEFCAAHALRHYQGKCERLHGHNYGVEVAVQGERLLPDTELLLDFTDLKALVKQALAALDHQFINEVPPFDSINPSAENLARWIWQRLAPLLPDGIKLHSVTVSEKDVQSATYLELEE